MMNNVSVPKKIVLMLYPVHPIASKVEGHKSNEINNPIRLDMHNSYFIQQPLIRNNYKTYTQNIFRYIAYARTHARNHIIRANRVMTFAPAIPFLEKHQR